jgi:DNA polymerase IV
MLQANVAIVNQDYVSDCLVFKSILLVTQLRFRVDGTPATATSEPVEETAAPDTSTVNANNFLQVKEPRRQNRRSITPCRSEDTPIDNKAPETVQKDRDIASSRQAEQMESDLLDELMLKVKAAGYLVS